MLQRIISVIILAFFFNLVPVASSQCCIRNEHLATIEELEHRNHPVVSPTSNQSGSIGCAQMEELNSTIQQGLQEIRGELQEKIQNIKEELQGGQEDINDNLRGMEGKLQGIQQLLSTILSLYYNPGYSSSHAAHSCKEIYDRNTSSPSGYYWLESSSEPIQAYCDMERTCGGVEGGWMKVISINMSNSSSS
jgi:gas vesicle protein